MKSLTGLFQFSYADADGAVTIEWHLNQQGNQVTGTHHAKGYIEYMGERHPYDQTENFSATIRGDQLVHEGGSATISPDFNSIKIVDEEGGVVLMQRVR